MKTQEAHEEILSLFNELSRELDGLTHFYYTPRAVAQESHATVLSNQRALPAMEMEDITPFGQHSYVSQQTPEEVTILSFILAFDDLMMCFFFCIDSGQEII